MNRMRVHRGQPTDTGRVVPFLRLAAVGSALGLSSACGLLDPTVRLTAQQPQLTNCKDSVCTPMESFAALQSALTYCQSLQASYQEDGLFDNRIGVLIASVGALAGTVASPLASGAAKTAWSGVSGATNGIQTAFNQSFGMLQMAKRRARIATAVDTFANTFPPKAEGTAYVISPTNAALLAAQCSSAAALADQETLSAVAAAGKDMNFTCTAAKPNADGSSSLTCTNKASSGDDAATGANQGGSGSGHATPPPAAAGPH